MAIARPLRMVVRRDWSVWSDLFTAMDLVSGLKDSSEPLFLRTDFASLRPAFADIGLSDDAQRMFEQPNAGGNSVASEVISLELMSAFVQAKLMWTEMELQYFPLGSKITDYSIRVKDATYGVSVTRAMKFRGEFSLYDAECLLCKKLFGVVQSSKNVLKQFRWQKQVLHIFAEADYIYDVLHRAYANICPELKSNTMIIVTVSPNARWLFYDK